jgi:Flp pilus assembly protein CpaB
MTINYRIRNIVIALALAAAAVLLTVIYVTSAKDDQAAGQEQVTVWVAERDFPVGTTGTKIAGSLRKDVVPRDAAAPQFVTSPDEVHGLLSTQPIYAGEQVTHLRFATPSEQGIRTELRGKLRAVSVAGDANQLLVGTLQAGDRVDVVGLFDRNGVGNDAEASVVLRNLRVLGTSDGGDGSEVTAESGQHAVVLALTDAQAQRFFLTTQKGKWTLQLRPVKKPQDSTRSIDTVDTVLAGGRR